MSTIFRTTLTPGKLELVAAWIVDQPWYERQDGAPDLARAGGFRLDDPDGEVGMEIMVITDSAGPAPVVYHVPVTYRGQERTDSDGPAALIGRAEHGVLGTRWVYDGERDPVLRESLAAFCNGDLRPQAQSDPDTLDPTVWVRGIDGPVSADDLAVVRRPEAGPTPDGGGITAPWAAPDGARVRGPLVART